MHIPNVLPRLVFPGPEYYILRANILDFPYSREKLHYQRSLCQKTKCFPTEPFRELVELILHSTPARFKQARYFRLSYQVFSFLKIKRKVSNCRFFSISEFAR